MTPPEQDFAWRGGKGERKKKIKMREKGDGEGTERGKMEEVKD